MGNPKVLPLFGWFLQRPVGQSLSFLIGCENPQAMSTTKAETPILVILSTPLSPFWKTEDFIVGNLKPYGAETSVRADTVRIDVKMTASMLN